MGRLTRVSAGMGAGLLAAALAGCSVVDTAIWGPEGAHVIETTEQVIRAAASGDGGDVACVDSDPEFGKAADWKGSSAGEPERFHAEYWNDQEPLNPAWNINLEFGPEGITTGTVIPSDVFYRETADGLCVVDIVWATIMGSG